MKKILRAILPLLILGLFLFPTLTVAQEALGIKDTVKQTGTAAGYNTSTSGQNNLAVIFGSIARLFISLIGIIFISYTIYGGFLWLTSAGNEEQITKAKNIIKNGIIGIIIILSSAAIYIFIRNFLILGGNIQSGGGISGSGVN